MRIGLIVVSVVAAATALSSGEACFERGFVGRPFSQLGWRE